MRDDLIILGIAGIAAYLIIKAFPAGAASVPLVGKIQIPDIFTPDLSSPYWSRYTQPDYLARQAAEEAAWGRVNQAVDGWTVG